jgi:hypothetical protein
MQEKHGPNGFLLGLLIGGAVGALVSSKKGRQILKDLADYGLEYVGKTIDMEDIETILNEDEEEMMGEEMDAEPIHETENEQEKKEEPVRRRLFRGIRKK